MITGFFINAPLEDRHFAWIFPSTKFIPREQNLLVMNDLNTRACCHISDKIGGNEKQEQNRSCFCRVFAMHVWVEFLRGWYKFADRFCVQLPPSGLHPAMLHRLLRPHHIFLTVFLQLDGRF